MGHNIINYAGYLSLILILLQIINEIRSLAMPLRSNLFNRKYFSWKEVYRFSNKLAAQIKANNIEYGMICGTGRGGGILAAIISYKLGLVPVLVFDRKYTIDDIEPNRSSICIQDAIHLDNRFQDLYNRPVLLITPQSDPGITLNQFKQVLINSGFQGPIDKCAIIASERTMDVDLKYCLRKYKPETKCRKFPWEKKNPDLMNNPLHIDNHIQIS